MSRRLACKVCRERKVRCDGESECDNCRRSGETCIYVPTQTTTKADLARTISILQERLGKFINLRGQRVQFVDCGPWLTVGYSDIDKAEASIASQNSTAFARDSNLLVYSNHNNGLLPQNSAWSQQHQTELASPDLSSMTFEFPGPLIDLGSSSRINECPVSLEDLSPSMQPFTSRSSFTQDSNSTQKSSGSETSHMPSLWEIRALNSTSSPYVRPMSPFPIDENQKDCSTFRSELDIFLTTVFRTQAEIAGISSVLADYLGWVRRQPLIARPDTTKTNYAMILETLEKRAREVHDLAEQNHTAAWRTLMESITRIDGLVEKMKPIEERVHRQAAERSQLFNENYDVCVNLSEQGNSP